MQLFLILALIIAIVAVIFAVQNVALVTIALFAWNIHTSLAVALLAALGVGVVITLLLSLPGMFKSGMNSVSQKKKFANLEAERDKNKQLADTAEAERDELKIKLEESGKDISNLEEQLASLSAALQEKQENPPAESIPSQPESESNTSPEKAE